ncbi:RNA-directed DNA polymerase, eukaryota [Tanacetum coccineum]
MSLSTPKLASMITSPTPNFCFQSPMHKYEDEEPLALTFGIGHCLDIDRRHSRREFLKSYNLSSGRSSVKEKMKRSVRKIGLRVYRLTWTWPSVFVLRCYVPFPSIEVKVVSQDHMHGEHDVFLEHLSHAMVLGDECVVNRKLDNCVMGEVKDFASINNFSWLGQLRMRKQISYLDERIFEVDIEGVPLHVLSQATISKIAKELFVWSPSFKAAKEDDYCSDEYVNKDATNNIEDDGNYVNGDAESDVECVSDTVFADQEDTLGHVSPRKWQSAEKEVSSDPFNLNDLNNRQGMQAKGTANSGSETSLPFPPGFTPDNVPIQNDVQVEAQGDASANSPLSCHSEGLSGSILDVLENMIKDPKELETVSNELSFPKRSRSWIQDQKRLIKDLNTKHKVNFLSIQETKLDVLSDMAVKTLWGNHRFELIISDAAGNSGGILCVWDPSFFRKEQHIISDNFVALYGTWIPKKANLLVISVYAPQPLTCKRVLWDYISTLINRWDGHCLVMGDFNEVRFPGDQMGTVFNVQGANEFNCFISNSGLTEVQLEGYSFTWSHPSAKKISKLDRFFITDGLLSLFPHISAVCLDRNLSDHRPILLREVVDYGPSPFRVFHSWFSYEGFDQMILDTWNGILLDDSNLMVRFKKKLQTLKKEIRIWVKSYKQKQYGCSRDIRSKLRDIDIELDKGAPMMTFFWPEWIC